MEDPKNLPDDELLEEKAVEEPFPGDSERIKILEEERETYRELAARAQAELINYRSRMEREMKKVRELAGERSALEMLPVLDNLDRALKVGDGSDVSTVVEGIKMVRRQFMAALEVLGLRPVPAVGEPFSPQFHEAVGVVDVDDKSMDGLVVEEFQTGYTLSEKVIRPAKVRVGTYRANEAEN